MFVVAVVTLALMVAVLVHLMGIILCGQHGGAFVRDALNYPRYRCLDAR
jgi:hypothetical protein